MKPLDKESIETISIALDIFQQHVDTFDYSTTPCRFDMKAERCAQLSHARAEIMRIKSEAAQ